MPRGKKTIIEPGQPQWEKIAAEPDQRSILERWDITIEELTEAVDQNPSMRGNMFGYVAEMKLRKFLMASGRLTYAYKPDDHARKKKGDLVVTYNGNSFIVESKSIQTNSVRRLVTPEGVKFKAVAQCDASDRRIIELPDGTNLNTTCLLIGEFDMLAVNLFAFGFGWRFIFAKNTDLPRSPYKGYTEEQRKYLLASNVPVAWPIEPPFTDDPFRLLDEIAGERRREPVTPAVEAGEVIQVKDEPD